MRLLPCFPLSVVVVVVVVKRRRSKGTRSRERATQPTNEPIKSHTKRAAVLCARTKPHSRRRDVRTADWLCCHYNHPANATQPAIVSCQRLVLRCGWWRRAFCPPSGVATPSRDGVATPGPQEEEGGERGRGGGGVALYVHTWSKGRRYRRRASLLHHSHLLLLLLLGRCLNGYAHAQLGRALCVVDLDRHKPC